MLLSHPQRPRAGYPPRPQGPAGGPAGLQLLTLHLACLPQPVMAPGQAGGPEPFLRGGCPRPHAQLPRPRLKGRCSQDGLWPEGPRQCRPLGEEEKALGREQNAEVVGWPWSTVVCREMLESAGPRYQDPSTTGNFGKVNQLYQNPSPDLRVSCTSSHSTFSTRAGGAALTPRFQRARLELGTGSS